MTEFPQDITERIVGTPEQEAEGVVGPPPKQWVGPVTIVDYDPSWPDRYNALRPPIDAALGDLIISAGHIGSTSVPGLAAKPVIDIDVVIDDTEDESRYVPPLERIGYRLLLRHPWWQGHRMLINADADVHLHIWPHDAAEPVRHRLLRDWLRTHPEDRDLYATTKQHLARETADRPEDYTMAKNTVIDAIFTRIFAAHPALRPTQS
ncbi:GrpB family protein [Winogradskya consettensis]|uniref:GrpB family protein n=1 Tax=Winogradskya consettensis TaxID=113560 RepID=A0A919VUI9_9ACTN|nr:GrpB family protein [Actinoplanes consettensis]GIM77216.1 hypothetical protein Aco04nite_54240 [Actinoplanes consettensis]